MNDLHGIFQAKLSPDKFVDVFVCFVPQKYLQQNMSLVSSKVARTQCLTRLQMKGTSAKYIIIIIIIVLYSANSRMADRSAAQEIH